MDKGGACGAAPAASAPGSALGRPPGAARRELYQLALLMQQLDYPLARSVHVDTQSRERQRCYPVVLTNQAEQDMFRADVAVAESARLLLR